MKNLVFIAMLALVGASAQASEKNNHKIKNEDGSITIQNPTVKFNGEQLMVPRVSNNQTVYGLCAIKGFGEAIDYSYKQVVEYSNFPSVMWGSVTMSMKSVMIDKDGNIGEGVDLDQDMQVISEVRCKQK